MRSLTLLLAFLLSFAPLTAAEPSVPPAGLKVLTAGHSFHVWMPPLVAEMVVVPGVSAVARPSLATVATLTDDELQLNVAPAMAVPAASRATAASSCDSPGTREPVVGDTVTTATVGGSGGEVGVVGAASAPPQPTTNTVTNTVSANSEIRCGMTETKVR